MEIGMLIFAFAILAIYYWKAQYGKYALPYLLFSLPVLYFSINMVTECMTADEWVHMSAIVDIENMKNLEGFALAMQYQYRTSQMVFGTAFRIIPQDIKNIVSIYTLLRIYKLIHWYFFFGIALFISSIWRNEILDKEINNIKFRFVDNVILYSLLALPVSCLLLKVCNYDAPYIYFAILGISLIVAAEKRDNLKYAYFGTIAAVFGCMDKFPGLLYWCICVMFFIYIGIRHTEFWSRKLVGAIKYCLLATGSAVGISWLSLVYLVFLENGLCAKINIGSVLFPLTHVLRLFISQNDVIDHINERSYCDGAVSLLFVIMLIILICAFIVQGYDWVNKKFNGSLSKVLVLVNAFLLCLSIVGGVIGAYCIPQYQTPYREIEIGYYNSPDHFGSTIYHFGATNAVVHFIYKLFYAYATILCNYPSVILLLLILEIYILVKRIDIIKESFVHIVMFISLIQPILFSIAGQPAGERYYGVTILMQVLICCYYIYVGKIKIQVNYKCRMAFCVLGALYMAEMLLFSPNIKIFSPVWVYRSEDYKQSIRKGTWYAGEAMTWGEDIAIAGNMIKDIVDGEGLEDYGTISIYGNYGNIWLNNPGFNIGKISKDSGASNYKWDDTEYMVLSKFTLYRYDVPEFIYEVDPVATIEYNGEISSWIYRGSQLEKYKEYFDE